MFAVAWVSDSDLLDSESLAGPSSGSVERPFPGLGVPVAELIMLDVVVKEEPSGC